MAIATRQGAPSVPNDPEVVSDKYDSITDSAANKAVQCTAKNLEGTPLEVTYWSQRLKSEDALRYQDQHLSPSYQSYNKINGLILKVISGVDFNIDNSNNQAAGSGTAIVVPFIKFNVGDMFVADVVNGAPTLFRVDESVLLSVHAASPYQLQFSVVGPVSSQTVNLVDLEEKTHTEYWYTDELATTCSGPLLSAEDLEEYSDLKTSYGELIREYMRLFIDRDTDAFILESEGKKLYDPFLSDFLIKTIPLDHIILRSIRGFNTHDVNFYTIFDMLLGKKSGNFSSPKSDLQLLIRGSHPGRNSSMYSSFTIVDWYVDSNGDTPFTDFNLDAGYTGEIDVDGVMLRLLPELGVDSYIFPATYYQGTYNSVFEQMVNTYLTRGELDRGQMTLLLSSFKQWSLAEKFYFGAILITLLKYIGGKGC